MCKIRENWLPFCLLLLHLKTTRIVLPRFLNLPSIFSVMPLHWGPSEVNLRRDEIVRVITLHGDKCIYPKLNWWYQAMVTLTGFCLQTRKSEPVYKANFIVPSESNHTADEISFEWSHCRTSSMHPKLRTCSSRIIKRIVWDWLL